MVTFNIECPETCEDLLQHESLWTYFLPHTMSSVAGLLWPNTNPREQRGTERAFFRGRRWRVCMIGTTAKHSNRSAAARLAPTTAMRRELLRFRPRSIANSTGCA